MRPFPSHWSDAAKARKKGWKPGPKTGVPPDTILDHLVKPRPPKKWESRAENESLLRFVREGSSYSEIADLMSEAHPHFSYSKGMIAGRLERLRKLWHQLKVNGTVS